jgi:hypothetical protein
MDTIDIILTIENIDKAELIEITINGILISINNKLYAITLHQGLPIQSIKINNNIINDYIKCRWNDLLIIPLDNKYENTIIFKSFVKKHLDNNDKLFINNSKVKYIQDEFLPINMIPNFPNIMYYIIKNINNINIKTGMPIINDNNKLACIVSKIENDLLYCIPINYVLLSINRKDNYIYIIDEELNNVKKINNYKIINDKIYCIFHKSYVPVDCYITINYDKINRIVLNNNIEKRIYPSILDNNEEGIIIKNNKLIFTSELLHLLKLLRYDNILDILMSMSKNKDYKFIHNEKKYIISSHH